MVPRPRMICSSFSSWSSLTALAVGLTDVGCCATAGTATTAVNASASATMARLKRDNCIAVPPLSFSCLRRDGLAVGGLPAPRARAVAALADALLVDLRDDLAVAGKQRLGRAHLGAQRQLAFGQTIGAVF